MNSIGCSFYFRKFTYDFMRKVSVFFFKIKWDTFTKGFKVVVGNKTENISNFFYKMEGRGYVSKEVADFYKQ